MAELFFPYLSGVLQEMVARDDLTATSLHFDDMQVATPSALWMALPPLFHLTAVTFNATFQPQIMGNDEIQLFRYGPVTLGLRGHRDGGRVTGPATLESECSLLDIRQQFYNKAILLVSQFKSGMLKSHPIPAGMVPQRHAHWRVFMFDHPALREFCLELMMAILCMHGQRITSAEEFNRSFGISDPGFEVRDNQGNVQIRPAVLVEPGMLDTLLSLEKLI